MLQLQRFTFRRPPHVTFHARCISSIFDARPGELSAVSQSSRVLFGAKVAAKQLGALSRASGMHKVLVVRDRDVAAASRTRFVEFLLMQVGIPCFQYTLERDCATLDGVDHAAAMAQRVGADGIVGFGGGNAMDMARAVAVVLANDGSAVDFVVDTSEAKAQRGKLKTGPLVLVPTMSGSGAEMGTHTMLLDGDAATKLRFAARRHIVPEVGGQVEVVVCAMATSVTWANQVDNGMDTWIWVRR